MPIEAPSHTPIGSRTHSEFVLCEEFVFRPSTVDGFSHQSVCGRFRRHDRQFQILHAGRFPTRSAGCSIFSFRKLKPKPADESLMTCSFTFSASPVRWPDIFCSRRRSRWVAIGICVAFAVWTFVCSGRFRQNGSPARRAVLVDGGFRARLAHHRAHRIRQDAMRDQHDHVPNFPERAELGRRLPRSKRTLLGNPCEDGRALRARRMISSCCKPGLWEKMSFGGRAHTINITGNPNVPASTYAKVIVDTAVSLTGGRGGNPFFPTKAQIAIQTGFEVLRHMEAYVTIPNIHRLLLNEEDANAAIETLMNKGDQRSHELVVAFRTASSNSRPSSLVACRERSAPIWNFFINPEIAEVFCANEPTFSYRQIDAGKIVCIAMPQKFQSERLYINTILKLSYYFHALSRFDKPAEEREKAISSSCSPMKGRRSSPARNPLSPIIARRESSARRGPR